MDFFPSRTSRLHLAAGAEFFLSHTSWPPTRAIAVDGRNPCHCPGPGGARTEARNLLRQLSSSSNPILGSRPALEVPTCIHFFSLPCIPCAKGSRSTDQRYAGDNRLMTPKSSYRRSHLAPRCRLITSWGWRRSQGFSCSPMKVVRELGLKRRETVRFLSTVGVKGRTARSQP